MYSFMYNFFFIHSHTDPLIQRERYNFITILSSIYYRTLTTMHLTALPSALGHGRSSIARVVAARLLCGPSAIRRSCYAGL